MAGFGGRLMLAAILIASTFPPFPPPVRAVDGAEMQSPHFPRPPVKPFEGRNVRGMGRGRLSRRKCLALHAAVCYIDEWETRTPARNVTEVE